MEVQILPGAHWFSISSVGFSIEKAKKQGTYFNGRESQGRIMKGKIITVFGSSQMEVEDPEYQRVLKLGKLLAEAGYQVCNGGYYGAMEASSRGAREAGGNAIGITMRSWTKKWCNEWVSQEDSVLTWKDRLFRLIETADGYVVCRGGTGTLVELACVWEMVAKGFMILKPIVIMDAFWEKTLEMLTTSPEIVKLSSAFHIAKGPAEAVQILNKELKGAF